MPLLHMLPRLCMLSEFNFKIKLAKIFDYCYITSFSRNVSVYKILIVTASDNFNSLVEVY